ncbi:MAG: hypothetical protein ACI8ZM_004470 [Crocinitomix sp.]|jgi:hypothetical protein
MINNNWIFGNNCGLDFTNSPAPPTATSGFAITTLEGCASVSDSNGDLLLYTDGSTIWNAVHTPIATALDGNSSSTQSAIIVPNPGNNQEYYVFTADGASGTNNHFNGGLVDVNANTFVPLANLMTLPSTAGFSPVEKVTAIQHANCKDFWVMTLVQKGSIGTSNGAGFLRLFLVTASGVQHISDTSLNVNTTDYGYMKGSSNGARIGIANLLDNEVYVFPFDNAAGTVQVGGLQTINAGTSNNYGLEFSPDSNLLYFSEYSTGNIFQVELSGLLIPNLVGSIVGQCGALQIGRDGVIYIAEASKSSVGAILDPNVIGSGCNVTNAYVALADGSTCLYGLPNLISNVCDDECGCGCNGCDKDATENNDELIERAKTKFNTVKSGADCADPFEENCDKSAIDSSIDFEPCFYFHWGDGAKDQIESHDTEVFYLTVCNNYNDIQYNGLRITKVKLVPNNLALDELQIVPDVLVNFDCLTPCSCQTREFAMITRSKDTVGNYNLEVEYCYEEIVIASSGNSGLVSFPVEITKD